MDILISVAAKIPDYTVAPIGRQLGYLCFYRENVDELKTQIERLGDHTERLQHKVDEAKRNGEEIEADVEKWLTHATNINKENGDFTRVEEQANTKCFAGAFPNLVLRYRLSRKAKKMAQIVDTEINNVKNFLPVMEVSYCPDPDPLSSLMKNNDYEAFETRKQTLKDIMEALRDPNVDVVGLWGTGGVGKTMLAKEVARRVKDEEKLFTKVIFTTISQTQNIEQIQQDILKSLGMDQASQQIEERLRNRLREENKILIIIDDVWNKLDLRNAGISFDDVKNRCKILVTSRSYHVLINDMHADKIVQVGYLLGDEPKNLFRKIVGDQADEKDDFKLLATQIVEECGGLPIAITTVASALKNKSCEVWKNALHELRISIPNNIKDMHEKVYSSIKVSYDFLESGEAKSLLLLCSTVFEEDEDIDIEELCNYSFGLNYFQGVHKLEDARNKMITLVGNLKNHSLLLDGDMIYVGGAFVKLHDVIRDFVIYIASHKGADQRIYNIRNADLLEEDSENDKLKNSTAISLYYINDDQYPQTLKSPKLKLLRLVCSKRRDLRAQLPRHLFEVLNELLVLHMKGVSIKTLPASSLCLLQTLRLNYCTLGDITWIGELQNLKILNLSSSSIPEQLPREIGKLKRLLSLDLHRCDVKVIPPNVISSLTRLEELNLEYSFENWELEGGVLLNGDERQNANFSEVINLPHLTNLNLAVPDFKMFSKEDMFSKDDMFSKKLKKYNIIIGSKMMNYYAKEASRKLMLKLCPNSLLSEHDFKVLLKVSDSITVNGLKSVKSVAYELDSGGFPQLKRLRLEDSTEIQCIVKSNGNMDNRAAFPSLKALFLKGLINLEKIIHEKLTAESFGKLIIIDVVNCDKLKSLFTLFNIPRQLEKIKLENCMMMEEIITDGRKGDPPKIQISQLQSLSLRKLPKLVQFKGTTKSDEISDVEQSLDNSVMPFFNGEVEFPMLKSLSFNSLKFHKIWNGQLPFQNLMSLTIMRCDQLNGVIPSSVIGSLVHLQQLRVEFCKAIEELVNTQESTQEAKVLRNISFPKLEDVQLCGLPSLERLFAGDHVDCPSLLRLEIEGCKKLGAFITNSTPTIENENADKQHYLFDHKHLGKTCQHMEKLNIIGCDRLKILATPSTSFQNLKKLLVKACHGLTSLFHRSTATTLSQLTYMSVDGCKSLRQIIANDDEMGAGNGNNYIIFSRLKTLVLEDLSSYASIYSGPNNVDVVLQFPSLNELSQIDQTWRNVEQLYIGGCDILKVLVTPSTSFQNLKLLVVTECHGLASLFHPSTVKSLVQLKKLAVGGCKSLRHIIAANDDDHEMAADNNSNIVFSQLEILLLYDLSNLTSFYSGPNDVVLQFPRLNEFFVAQCPKMKTFSNGNIISCPTLDKLFIYDNGTRVWGLGICTYTQEYKRRPLWEGDVNTSIQKLWEITNTMNDSSQALRSDLFGENREENEGEGEEE